MRPLNIIRELLAGHEAAVIQLPTATNDSAGKNKGIGTAGFLTGLMELHETTAWILRRYLA